MAGQFSVRDFYRNKNVLITGASGFLGKVILHRVLTSGPEVGDVYLLVRAKKGASPEERLEKIVNAVIFDDLRRDDPDRLKRVHLVAGDVNEPGLALSQEDVSTLSGKVNVILHAAADVNFDRKLSEAYNLNCGGTKRLIELGKRMDDLQVFVYVSTAYSHCNRPQIEDKILFDPYLSGHSVESFQRLEADPKFKVSRFIKDWPNTYCFSKAITEQTLLEYKHLFPIVVVRPSIILGAIKEPLPGWTEGLQGMNGLVAASGVGLASSIHGGPEKVADVVPVDAVANLVMAASARHACPASQWSGNNNSNGLDGSSDDDGVGRLEIPVYNSTSGAWNPIGWQQLTDIIMHYWRVHPVEGALWRPAYKIHTSKTLYWVDSMVSRRVPAFVLDLCRRAVGMRPWFTRVSNRLTSVEEAFFFFTSNEWDWGSKRARRLHGGMTDQDRKDYNFDLTDHDWSSYIHQLCKGIRRFDLKQSPATLAASRRRMAFLRALRAALLLATYAAPLYLAMRFHARRGTSSEALQSVVRMLTRMLQVISAGSATAARYIVSRLQLRAIATTASATS